MSDIRKELKVVKHSDGWVELRENGRHVKFLKKGISFVEARLQAYEYVWARPQYLWTIKGVAS